MSELEKAFFEAKQKFPVIPKNGRNTFYKSPAHPEGAPYVVYEDLVSQTAPALKEFGLSLRHSSRCEGRLYFVGSYLVHVKSGEVGKPFEMPIDGDGPQKVAAGITYAKRVTGGAVLGVSSDEDADGNSTISNRAPPTKPQQIEDAEAKQKPMSNLAGAGKDYKITPKQQGLVFAVSKTKGWSINEVAEYCSLRHGINDWRTISKSMLDDLLKVMDKQDPLSAIDGLVNKDAPPLTDNDIPFGS